ncbi:MAG: ATP-binding cassette domain-containing protein [Thermoplasmata archaeon]|nr:ATP-binding cassette domain-containing protein [Thermoplasmata archaeon]
MEYAVEAESLSKTFGGSVKAVQDVSFKVREGEVFGFLGPNGAGKSTTVGMLTTVLKLTSGRATVDGIDVRDHPSQVRRRIGVIFQESTADDELTGLENLHLAGALYGVSKSETNRRSTELLASLHLEEAARRRVKTYSGGMRRRLEIAASLVHTPRVLFLDEPTLGLDPQARAGIGETIRTLQRDHGVTVFLTTHYLDEADRLCDRIAIIDKGEIRALGTPSELKEKVGGDIVTVTPNRDTSDLSSTFAKVPGVLAVQRQDGSYRLKSSHGEGVVPGAVEAAIHAGVGLASVNVKRPSLDEVFLEFTGRSYREDEGPSATDWAVRVQKFRGGR